MRVLPPREPRDDGRWRTIRFALVDTARTVRLCLILMACAVVPLAAIITAVVERT